MSGVTDEVHEIRAVRVRVVVTGRVQGVFFRDACRERATEERLTGWVRNRADGSVEAELEGPRAAVDRLVTWFHGGPPRARVDSIELTTVAPTGDPRFRII
jgi:acylphosphatase